MLNIYLSIYLSIQAEIPVVDWVQKESDGEVPIILGALGNTEHPFIAIAPRSTLAQRGSTW